MRDSKVVVELRVQRVNTVRRLRVQGGERCRSKGAGGIPQWLRGYGLL